MISCGDHTVNSEIGKLCMNYMNESPYLCFLLETVTCMSYDNHMTAQVIPQ